MSLSDNEPNNNSFFSSTEVPLGEEKKNGTSNDHSLEESCPVSFSFNTPTGIKIDAQTLQDVISSVPAERRWTVDGIMPECGLAVVGGRHKRGKSTLVIHLARSVEAGALFLDRATQKGVVAYINYEMPLDYFASLSKAEPVPRNFYVIDHPEPKLSMHTIAAIIGELKNRGFESGILVIDSFRGAFKLKADHENLSGEAGVILRNLQEIGIKTRWLLIVIHHHRKNSDAEGADNLSGTGDFGAAADVIWTWSRPSDASKPGKLEIEGRIKPVDPFVVMLSPEGCVYLGTEQGAKEEEEKQRILQVISIERLVGKDIAVRTGIHYGTVMKRLGSLKEEGRADCAKGEGKGSPLFWYAIEPAASAELHSE